MITEHFAEVSKTVTTEPPFGGELNGVKSIGLFTKVIWYFESERLIYFNPDWTQWKSGLKYAIKLLLECVFGAQAIQKSLQKDHYVFADPWAFCRIDSKTMTTEPPFGGELNEVKNIGILTDVSLWVWRTHLF